VIKNWLWGASALLGAILIVAREIHHLVSVSDFGLLLLVTHGLHYLINEGFSHLIWIVGLVALITFIVFAFRQGLKVKPSGNSAWPRDTIAGSCGDSAASGQGG
jgi:hypothetical protein